MVGGEVVDIVEGMLRRAKKVLRIRGRDQGFYSYAQREDWLTDLPCVSSYIGCQFLRCYTLPSAQSVMSCSGNSAL
jgi:hypothetical protein